MKDDWFDIAIKSFIGGIQLLFLLWLFLVGLKWWLIGKGYID